MRAMLRVQALLLALLFTGLAPSLPSAPMVVVSGPRLFVSASTTTYSTSFALTENPISEGGKWAGGATDGTLFRDVRTTPGLAFATGLNSSYDDSLALIKAPYCTAADQFAEGVVYKPGGYTPPASHEIELLLRGSFNPAGPSYAPLYEISFGYATDVSIYKQDGTFGGYTPLGGTGTGIGHAVNDGDVVRAKIVGSVITVYYNGVQVLTVTDSSLASGKPGMGYFVTDMPGSDTSKFGFSSWNCGPAT